MVKNADRYFVVKVSVSCLKFKLKWNTVSTLHNFTMISTTYLPTWLPTHTTSERLYRVKLAKKNNHLLTIEEVRRKCHRKWKPEIISKRWLWLVLLPYLYLFHIPRLCGARESEECHFVQLWRKCVEFQQLQKALHKFSYYFQLVKL